MRVKPLYDFMIKREKVRLAREAGLPFPWTRDPILREYKFTNVKREHDRTTQILRDEFYTPNFLRPPEVCLINCAIFRYFGTYEFARALGWQSDFVPEVITDLARERLDNRERVFTGAYLITNNGVTGPKEEVVTHHFLAPLWTKAPHLSQIARETCSWRAVAREMTKVMGFGGTGFMTKEVLLDAMFTGFFPLGIEDRNDWCPAGPGARRGINRLLGRDVNVSMQEPGALNYMKEIFEARHRFWPSDYVELELHDVQFQLCEFDKYERVRLGQGRPRSKYKPPQE